MRLTELTAPAQVLRKLAGRGCGKDYPAVKQTYPILLYLPGPDSSHAVRQ